MIIMLREVRSQKSEVGSRKFLAGEGGGSRKKEKSGCRVLNLLIFNLFEFCPDPDRDGSWCLK